MHLAAENPRRLGMAKLVHELDRRKEHEENDEIIRRQ